MGIDVSCDSAVLAVCQQKPDIGTVASMLDIKSLITGGGVKFICDIRLTNSCNAELIDFKWNPAVPGNFSFCSSDHSVGVIQLKDSGFTIEGMQKFQNGATCGQ